ncbi:flagellar brake protein [Undibacterium sp. RuRC25W]|uniref:flagellar brake protein n=1 Tax=Undibacterium sp. RuRC25W TaxID=3413047 RepID=UPI003BEFCE5E
MNEGGENHISNEPVTLLQPNDVPIGAPLEWPIFDTCGVLLFDRGATLSQAEDRTFLFQHFQPQRGDLDANEIPSLSNEDLDNQQEPLTVNDLDLTIGMSLGIRAMAGKGGPMHASKLIGLAQNDALFIMAPVQRGQPLFFVQGEQIEVVAVSVRAVFFSFVQSTPYAQAPSTI